MNKEAIIKLLEKYWNCDITQEEEKALYAFFGKEEIPEELKKYHSLFLWRDKQLRIGTDKQFRTRFRKPFVVRFYPMIKAAAAVLLLLIVGVGISTHYQQEKLMDKIFSETYSDPEDALNATTKVIVKVSSVLSLDNDTISEEQQSDSLSTSKIISE